MKTNKDTSTNKITLKNIQAKLGQFEVQEQTQNEKSEMDGTISLSNVLKSGIRPVGYEKFDSANKSNVKNEQDMDVHETGSAKESWDTLHPLVQQVRQLFNELPEEEALKAAIEVTDLMSQFIEQASPQKSKAIDVPPLPKPDSSGNSYKLFEPRTNPVEHLERVWGKWLKRFNPELERDYLFQDELHKLDCKLLTSLKNRQRTTGEPVSSFVSPMKQRNNYTLTESGLADTKEAKRIASLISTRHHRTEKIIL